LPVIKKWSDLDLDFTAHPSNGQLSMKRDEQSIVRSVRYTLLTNFYERLFNPGYGSDLTGQLFQPVTYSSTLSIRDAITECLNNFEKRIQLTNVEVNANHDKNSYEVSLKFYIVNEQVERQTRFLLERNR
jgi:phage baseplate assembly protein W